ncbi:unnamed protein product [Rhizophagus irregularis]|nr:unnamed protein product [Rhizophagus irregularis]
MLYLWYINASYSKLNNPDSAIFINKIVDEHNHDLSIKAVKFREDKKFNDKMFSSQFSFETGIVQFSSVLFYFKKKCKNCNDSATSDCIKTSNSSLESSHQDASNGSKIYTSQ